MLVLTRIQTNQWQWLSSSVVDDEIEQTPDVQRRERMVLLAMYAHYSMTISDGEIERAKQLVNLGFVAMNALHLACAEKMKVDGFFTTDDKLLRRAARMVEQLYVTVDNPLVWFTNRKEMEAK